jgi:hypothetical protein
MMYTLLIERSGDSVRGIIIDRDEETGARSVVDILETIPACAPKLFAAVADSFGEWELAAHHLAEVDFGRARTNLTRIRKVVEQLP